MSSILTRLGSRARIRSRIATPRSVSTLERRGAGDGMGEQAVDRAFEIAAVGLKSRGRRRRAPAASRKNADSAPAPPRCAPRGFLCAEVRRGKASRRTAPRPDRERTRSSTDSRSLGGRSEATSTCRPASTSAIEGMAEFGLDHLALEELRVVEDEQVDGAQRLLEAQRASATAGH